MIMLLVTEMSTNELISAWWVFLINLAFEFNKDMHSFPELRHTILNLYNIHFIPVMHSSCNGFVDHSV